MAGKLPMSNAVILLGLTLGRFQGAEAGLVS
jgi:hypothetical protein